MNIDMLFQESESLEETSEFYRAFLESCKNVDFLFMREGLNPPISFWRSGHDPVRCVFVLTSTSNDFFVQNVQKTKVPGSRIFVHFASSFL